MVSGAAAGQSALGRCGKLDGSCALAAEVLVQWRGWVPDGLGWSGRALRLAKPVRGQAPTPTLARFLRLRSDRRIEPAEGHAEILE